MQVNVKEFHLEYFTKKGVQTETNKVERTDPNFSRMSNRKLKKEKGRKASTDHREGKHRPQKLAETPSRRTHGSRAEAKKNNVT